MLKISKLLLLSGLFAFGLSACGQDADAPKKEATAPPVAVAEVSSAASIAEEISSGNYGKAAEAATAALAVDPSDPNLYFQLARAEARLQNVGAAVKALQSSFDTGFYDPRGALNNPDFDGIRTNPIFIAFAKRFQRQQVPLVDKAKQPPASTVTAGDVAIIEGPDGRTHIRAGDVAIED